MAGAREADAVSAHVLRTPFQPCSSCILVAMAKRFGLDKCSNNNITKRFVIAGILELRKWINCKQSVHIVLIPSLVFSFTKQLHFGGIQAKS